MRRRGTPGHKHGQRPDRHQQRRRRHDPVVQASFDLSRARGVRRRPRGERRLAHGAASATRSSPRTTSLAMRELTALADRADLARRATARRHAARAESRARLVALRDTLAPVRRPPRRGRLHARGGSRRLRRAIALGRPARGPRGRDALRAALDGRTPRRLFEPSRRPAGEVSPKARPRRGSRTRPRACARAASSPHSVLTALMTAFERVEESRPCSWNQPRSASMPAIAYRSQTLAEQLLELAGSWHRSTASANARGRRARRTSRATATTWSCASMSTSNGSRPSSMPPFRRRAAPDLTCSSRQRNSSSWVSRSSRSPVSSLPGRRSSAMRVRNSRIAAALGDRLDDLAGRRRRRCRAGRARRTDP